MRGGADSRYYGIIILFSVFRITTKGVHVSEEADLWFSKYLGLEGLKLYCYPVDGTPRKSDLKPKIAETQYGVSFQSPFTIQCFYCFGCK